MGIFFDDIKPRITKDEFKKIRNSLALNDFTEKERDVIESFFEGAMFENREIDKGIDKKEIEQGIETLRKNQQVYNLSDKKLDILREKLQKYI